MAATRPPGFLVAELINDSDNESNDIVNLDTSSHKTSSPDNPFINFKAEELMKVSQKNQCLKLQGFIRLCN